MTLLFNGAQAGTLRGLASYCRSCVLRLEILCQLSDTRDTKLPLKLQAEIRFSNSVPTEGSPGVAYFNRWLYLCKNVILLY